MVVPWPRETLVPVEVEEAEKNGVRILCREDLEELLALALAGASVRKIARFIIPERTQGGPVRYVSATDRNPLAPRPDDSEAM
jgi:hypothetical protein